jgi:Icc-related predicted phosphoesterase
VTPSTLAHTKSPACRVAAIADLHGFLPDVPACDLLLVAGDVCPVEDHRLDFQRRWLEGPFADWLGRAGAGAIVGIAGNHDFVAEADPPLMRSLPWTYLCDEAVDVGGLLVHGSPWTPTFRQWAFMRDDEELARTWALVPDDVDVLVTHGPSLGHGDLVVDGRHAGSATLAGRLAELPRLRLHAFGHIHEAGGSLDPLGAATLANVSYVDFYYRPVRPVAVFDL